MLSEKLEAKKVEIVNALEKKRRFGARMGAGIIPMLLVLAVVIILLGVIPIVVYIFFNIGTTIGSLSTNQKGNVSNIINNSVSALNLGSLLPLVIIISLIISVLLGIFAVGYIRNRGRAVWTYRMPSIGKAAEVFKYWNRMPVIARFSAARSRFSTVQMFQR